MHLGRGVVSMHLMVEAQCDLEIRCSSAVGARSGGDTHPQCC